MDKVFNPVAESHDPKNRIVFVCSSDQGFYVSKPRTGFKSRCWPKQDHPELLACFNRQRSCSHNAASYLPNELQTAEASAPVKRQYRKKSAK